MDHRRGAGLPRDPYNSYAHQPQGQHPKPEWHDPVVGGYNYDKTGLIPDRTRRGGEYPGAYRGSGSSSAFGRWYQRRRLSPWSILFLALGMFLLLCGLVNVLVCIDYHNYCRFWAGVIVSSFIRYGMK